MIDDFVEVNWAPASNPLDENPTWVDITPVVMEVTVEGGRSGVFDLYGPRTATIRCKNGTRSEAPTFTLNGFHKWRQVWIRALSGGNLFIGYIVSMTHTQTDAPWLGEVTIECVDKLAMISRAEFSANAGATVNGITSAVTMQQALEELAQTGLPIVDLNILGESTAYFKYPDADEGAAAPTGNLLQWLQDVMEAEVGTFQTGVDTLPCVLGRWAPFLVAAQGVTMTLSDSPGVGEYPFLRENLTFAAVDENYYNRAVAKSSEWETVFTEDNVPSGYPVESLSRTDLPFIYSSWAEANASLWMTLYSQAVTYPRSVVLFVSSAREEQAVLPYVMAACNIFGAARVIVKQTPAGSGTTQQTYEVTVDSCRHEVTPTLWKTTLGFSSLDRWIDGYGDGTDIYPLVEIDGDSDHGIESPIGAIIAP